MRSWLINSGIPIVVAIGFALAITVATMSREPATAIEVRPPELQPTPVALIYVHVDGAVATPGVYALASGGRVFEAIEAAGGATDDADTSALNLAAKVADGQKLVVPLRRASGSVVEAAALAQAAGIQAQPGTNATIGLNTATQKMLESLPGVGPVTASRIVTRRTSVGPFTHVEQLKDEKIVNASVFERIKGLVSVD